MSPWWGRPQPHVPTQDLPPFGHTGLTPCAHAGHAQDISTQFQSLPAGHPWGSERGRSGSSECDARATGRATGAQGYREGMGKSTAGAIHDGQGRVAGPCGRAWGSANCFVVVAEKRCPSCITSCMPPACPCMPLHAPACPLVRCPSCIASGVDLSTSCMPSACPCMPPSVALAQFSVLQGRQDREREDLLRAKDMAMPMAMSFAHAHAHAHAHAAGIYISL